MHIRRSNFSTLLHPRHTNFENSSITLSSPRNGVGSLGREITGVGGGGGGDDVLVIVHPSPTRLRTPPTYSGGGGGGGGGDSGSITCEVDAREFDERSVGQSTIEDPPTSSAATAAAVSRRSRESEELGTFTGVDTLVSKARPRRKPPDPPIPPEPPDPPDPLIAPISPPAPSTPSIPPPPLLHLTCTTCARHPLFQHDFPPHLPTPRCTHHNNVICAYCLHEHIRVEMQRRRWSMRGVKCPVCGEEMSEGEVRRGVLLWRRIRG